MSIAVTCPCGTRLRAKDELAGKTAVCPSCHAKVAIPGTAGGPRPRAAAAAPREAPPTGAGARKGVLVAATALALVVVAAVAYFAWPRGPAAAAATITAAPNPAPAGPNGFGTTTVTWDTGDGRPGEVYVSVNGAPEKLFSGAMAKGSQAANWIGNGVYEFRLYAGQEHKTLLAAVKVTWREQ